MITFDQQLKLFKLIGNTLKSRAECYVIGGSAMMFYDAKAETLDIDLVFMDKKDLDNVKEALISIGFELKSSLIKIFKRYDTASNTPIMMVRKDERFDLFVKEIISFVMSDTITKRVKETHEFDNLIVKVVSPEDIILMKCATEREKDRYDASNLIKKTNINWDILIKESIHQAELTPYLFPVFLFDFLYELKEDLKADIPKEVLNKIRKISEDMLEKTLKKRSEKK